MGFRKLNWVTYLASLITSFIISIPISQVFTGIVTETPFGYKDIMVEYEVIGKTQESALVFPDYIISYKSKNGKLRTEEVDFSVYCNTQVGDIVEFKQRVSYGDKYEMWKY